LLKKRKHTDFQGWIQLNRRVRKERTSARRSYLAAITQIVKHLVSTGYEDIPAPAVESAKKEVLDSLATALGGSTRPGVPELVDMVREFGGNPQSTVIAYGMKCPAPEAALVNGTMIHALDYDDGHQTALVHIGCVAVSTCFAVAERMGTVNGRDFIAALALGGDLLARLGMASRPGGNALDAGWHPTTMFGFLGAAAMAGKLTGLDEDKMTSALGLAYHQCGGAGSGVADGAMAKRLGPGLAARGGVLAGLMAERGITGERDPLEGDSGIYTVYMGGDYSPDILTGGLGEVYEGVNIGDKPYPCCGLTHACIDAALSLREKYSITPDMIKHVAVYGGQTVYDLAQPPEIKNRPRTIIDAQFSVPWVVAAALLNGRVTVDDFTDEAITRPEALAMTEKVDSRLEPSMNRHGVGPGGVVITMQDGTEYREEVEHCLGSVERPMTFEDCARKFRECAAASVKPLNSDTVEKVIADISRLEELEDAAEIIRLL
jgi:2-methylcitrate dehydratase PrpD